MKYVYLLQSQSEPDKRYIGITSEFQKRLKQHNSSSSRHTKKYQPWTPVVVIRYASQLDELTFSWSVQHFEERGLSPRSVKSYMVVYRAVIRWSVKRKLLRRQHIGYQLR